MGSLLRAIPVRGWQNATSSCVLRTHRQKNLLGAAPSARQARTNAAERKKRRVCSREKIDGAAAVREMESVRQSKSAHDNSQTISIAAPENGALTRATAANLCASGESRHSDGNSSA